MSQNPYEQEREYEADDPLEADSVDEAVIVQQWRNSQAVAMGNEEKGEWLIAPAAYGLDMMR